MPPPSSFRRAVFPRKRPHTWNSYSTLKRRKRLRRDIRKIDNGSLRVGKWMPPTMTLNHTFKKTFRMHWPIPDQLPPTSTPSTGLDYVRKIKILSL